MPNRQKLLVLCPACNSSKGRVFDSRSVGGEVKRKRECEGCGHRWATLEVNLDDLTALDLFVEETPHEAEPALAN
jgi:transcriptional regulator NrdR family protein